MPRVKNPQTVPRPVFERTPCAQCGEMFERITPWAKYCSDLCRNYASCKRRMIEAGRKL